MQATQLVWNWCVEMTPHPARGRKLPLREELAFLSLGRNDIIPARGRTLSPRQMGNCVQRRNNPLPRKGTKNMPKMISWIQ